MKKQEFAQNHQKWYIYVSVILFHVVENHEKLLIASKRARSGDFSMYHDFYLKINSEKTGIGSKLKQIMGNL